LNRKESITSGKNRVIKKTELDKQEENKEIAMKIVKSEIDD
jgi:hypothetical protein